MPHQRHHRSLLAFSVAAMLLAGAAGGAAAEEARPQAADLSPAQIALFETPHLAALPTPLRLDYAFRREEEGKEPVEDRIRLELRAARQEGRRDVHPEFFSGPRAIAYPPALGFRGNPLLLFALDRDTRELSGATGGSALWFRNRIRHALAEGAAMRDTEIALEDGRRAPAVEIAIAPFAGEPRARRYQGRRYVFVLSEAVPGAIHAIRTELPAGEGGGAVRESIVFAGATASPPDAAAAR